MHVWINEPHLSTQKKRTRIGQTVDIHELSRYLDIYLDVLATPDYSGAVNGLQVENSGRVSRVGLAVDASQATIREAVKRACDVIIVHHGLFWDGNLPVTGRRYRRLQQLISNDVALYSAHLPLDVHPDVGNNAQLAKALGIRLQGNFGRYQNIDVGVWGALNITREALAARLDDVLGVRVRLLAGGAEKLSRIGVITGGAGSMINDAVNARLDAFVTGEGAHQTYFDAMENGINVYYGGHYATETFGVRALGKHIEEKFDLPTEFIDLPTGL